MLTRFAKGVKRYGLRGALGKSFEISVRYAQRQRNLWKYRAAQEYKSPTEAENCLIEEALTQEGIVPHDLCVDVASFETFKQEFDFPPEYYAGDTGVREEKLLEHYIAYTLGGIGEFSAGERYVDVAAHNSPWVALLRTKHDISAVGIDLHIPDELLATGFYFVEDATNTSFEDKSVALLSLQCAYEMFAGNDDVKFIDEAARILKPGGKAVIVPLYLHTHHCFYASAEHYGTGPSDAGATAYIRREAIGVPFSRKYDPVTLKERLLSRIVANDLQYRLLVLRNPSDVDAGVYCRFVLEITKPSSA